ncbi:MAG: hypothetical protein LBQ28_01395 [Prevotellaceae bacterium]|jgi:hypothetical protein|nr:hypothetical protein [Prevotellaceae bacterium]
MKRIISIFALILIVFNSYSQQDSIENEILNYSSTKSDIISKGRRLLLDKFIEGDYAKVKTVKDYLINLEDNDYKAVFAPEHWLILYWTQEYDTLLTGIKNFKKEENYYNQGKINPQLDLLFKKIKEKSIESEYLLQQFISNSVLQDVEKDFLRLHLYFMLTENPSLYQDTINDLADTFLTKYPDNDYENFTREYIRYKLIQGKWGLGFEFFSGYNIYNGDINQYFSNNIPIGIAFDAAYKQFNLYLRAYVGIGKTKKDIIRDDIIWDKGSQANTYSAEISLGPDIIDSKSLKITPFSGISIMGISPTENDISNNKDLKHVELKTVLGYVIGLNLDIKLKKTKLRNYKSFSQNPFGYTVLRLRYTYCVPKFESRYKEFKGNIHYISIGIGLFARQSLIEY